MYEDKMKVRRSKRLYHSPFDYWRSVSMYFKNHSKAAIKNSETEKFVHGIVSHIVGEIEQIYGIQNVEVATMVIEFYTTDKGYEWLKIVDGTKRYFGV